MFKILQKFLPEIINLLLTFYLQAQQILYHYLTTSIYGKRAAVAAPLYDCPILIQENYKQI